MAVELTENPYGHLVRHSYHGRHDSCHHALLGTHRHALLDEAMHYDHARNAAPLRVTSVSFQAQEEKNLMVDAICKVQVQEETLTFVATVLGFVVHGCHV